MLVSAELNRMLVRFDDLAREHCGMPIDVPRLTSNKAYREAVFRALERSPSGELRHAVATLRNQLAALPA